MPTFVVTSPDGRKFRVNAPEGATQEQAIAYAQAQIGESAAADGAEQAAADTPGWKAPLVAGGRILDRWAAGARALTPEPVRNAVDAAGRALGMGEPPSIDPAVQADNTARYAALERKYPGGTFAGELAATMAAKTPLGMAAMGALEYGTPGERLTRGAFGYGGGKAGEYVGKGLSRLFGPESAAGAGRVADEFMDAGGNKWNIPLSVGQRTQSKPAQIVESVVSNMPGGAGVMAKARDRTFGAFNKAITKTFGEDSAAITPELLGAARKRAGGTIGELAERNTMRFDEPAFNELLRISERAKTDLTPDQGKIVVNWINNIVRDVTPEQTIAGKVYKAYDSRLGKLSKDAGGTLGDVLGDLRKVMRDAMDRSISPEDAAKWATARKQYLNLMTVSEATKSLGASGAQDAMDSFISPARLLQAVNTAQKNARFGSGNDLAELAQWAKLKLPDKIPNSGTAQRLLYQKLLENPLTTIGAAGGLGYGADQLGLGSELATSIPLSYAVARAMAGKPTSKSTEELLKRLGGGLLGTVALNYGR